jgi:hypothetical protein
MMSAVGQAELGKNTQLVKKYKALAKALVRQEAKLMRDYGVPPATGKGRKRRKKTST